MNKRRAALSVICILLALARIATKFPARSTFFALLSAQSQELPLRDNTLNGKPLSKPLCGNYAVYSITDGRTLVILSKDGMTAHYARLPERPASWLTLLPTDHMVLASQDKTKVFFCNQDGKLLWERQLENPQTSPAAYAGSGIILVPHEAGVTALNVYGETVWEREAPAAPPIVFPNGTIFFPETGGDGGTFATIFGNTLEMKGPLLLAERKNSLAASETDTNLYTLDADGSVWSYSKRNGSVAWKEKLPLGGLTDGSVQTMRDKILVTAKTPEEVVAAVFSRDGKFLYRKTFRDRGYTVFSPQGLLFLYSTDWTVSVFETPVTGGIAETHKLSLAGNPAREAFNSTPRTGESNQYRTDTTTLEDIIRECNTVSLRFIGPTAQGPSSEYLESAAMWIQDASRCGYDFSDYYARLVEVVEDPTLYRSLLETIQSVPYDPELRILNALESRLVKKGKKALDEPLTLETIRTVYHICDFTGSFSFQLAGNRILSNLTYPSYSQFIQSEARALRTQLLADGYAWNF